VAIPILIAAFSVVREQPLSVPTLTPTFDAGTAAQTVNTLATEYSDRSPGAPSSSNLLAWMKDQFTGLGLDTSIDHFSARIPGLGEVDLANVSATVPGRSSTEIVVLAHRDNAGESSGGGANDDASGTAVMLGLARAYENRSESITPPQPAHTLVFLSTDGGAFGAIGASHFAHLPGNKQRIAAVIALDSVGGRGPVRVLFNGDSPGSASPVLVATAYELLGGQPNATVTHTSSLDQLFDLAFPFSLYEQAPFVSAGIPAVTITTAGDRPPNPLTDTVTRISPARLRQVGQAAEQLLAALDQGAPEPHGGGSSYLYVGGRFVSGWAIQLVLIIALLPALVAIIDLFARCRRQHIPLRAAFRSFVRRLGFWLSLLVLFWFFALFGFWPRGQGRPLSLDTSAATSVPLLALAAFVFLAFAAWFISRDRLIPRKQASSEEELAGYTSALLVIAAVAIIVVILNAYAILFLLLPIHVWIWSPQVRHLRPWTPLALLVVGLVGPLAALWELAARLHLGLNVLWYVAELAAVGYLGISILLVTAVMAAAAGQLAALSAGRYAPYPAPAELPDRTLPQRIVGFMVSRMRRWTESRHSRQAHGD
jgi:hypothetical protein